MPQPIAVGAVLGGRAGRWSEAGFTFDTGPSWYLMPEVIDRWFRLMGTSAAERLDLRRLDPGYRVYFEEHLHEPPVDVRTGHAEALFESLEPGAGRRLRAYLDSASRIYGLAKEHFLYTDFRRPADLARPAVLLGDLKEPLGRVRAAVKHDVLDPLAQLVDWLGLVGDLAQGDDGVLVVVAVHGQRRARGDLAGAVGGKHHQVKAVRNLVDAVLDGHACHATPLRIGCKSKMA